MAETLCTIPVSTIISVQNGQAIVEREELAAFPPSQLAAFFVEKFGADAIYGRE